MNMHQTLANLDKILGIAGPKVTTMTKAEFETHAASEIGKAKAEVEEEDKAKGAAKAKKRLEFLRATTKLVIAKSSWEGGNGTAAIPVYEEGFEAPTELPTDTTIPATSQGTGGTNADGSTYAAKGGAQGFGDAATGGSGSNGGGSMPASGVGTQSDNTIFANSAIGKAMEGLSTVLKGIAGTIPDAKTGTPAAPAAFEWPRDIAQKAFMEEGNAQRGETWGVDDKAAPAK